MFFLEDLKYNKLYSNRKQFNIPYDKNDKRKGAAILLLSPSYEVSNSLMNNSVTVDRMKLFSSYYIEKDIMFLVNNEGYIYKDYYEYDGNGVILENSSVFREVTDVNIKDDLKEYGESNNAWLKMGDNILFFNELYDEYYLTEAADKIKGLNTKYKNLLFYDRLRNNKEVIILYDKVKADNPWILRAFPMIERYKRFNLYVDLYYYNQTYLHNNTFTLIKSVDMYLEFINRFINDRRLTDAGYTKKTIYLPVYGWEVSDKLPVWDYKSVLNPISVIYKKLKMNPTELNIFSGYDIVFFGLNGYFKFNVGNIPINFYIRFKKFIDKLTSNEVINDEIDIDEPQDSPDGITADIVETIENSTGAKINNLNPKDDNIEVKKEIEDKYNKLIKDTNNITSINNLEKAKKIDLAIVDAENRTAALNVASAQKNTIVKKIKSIAQLARDKDEVIEKMDQDNELKQMIYDLENETPDGVIELSAVQVNKLNKVNDAFLKSKIDSKSIKEILDKSNKPKELDESSIPIETINDEWHHIKAINFEKEYNLDADIYNIIYSFSDKSRHMYPMGIKSIEKTDVSNSEDSIYLYTVHAMNYRNESFTFKFFIPKLRNNRFMRLRGNEKVFSIELPLLPISKTDDDTAQLSTLYKKIIMSRQNTSAGRSNQYSDKIIKALKKYKGHNIKIVTGDNSRICEKYELPIDYIDLASLYNTITFKSKTTGKKVVIYFNQDDIRNKKNIKVDVNKGIPIAIIDDTEVIYYTADATVPVSSFIANMIDDPQFETEYEEQSELRRATYSMCKVAGIFIPTIVVLAHDIGLTKAMDLAKVKYKITKTNVDTKNSNWNMIKLADGYLLFENNYQSLMLMDGLKECDMNRINIMDLNKKMTWINQLDLFGSRQKSDTLDNFKELMWDPITVEICKDYKLPLTYHEALIYASNLLVDNKYSKHTNISTNRYRTNEVIAAHFYLAFSTAYQQYIALAKRNRKAVIYMKDTAVIDSILQQNTTSDLSVFQPLLEIEMRNQISSKGAGGLNEEHSYVLEKRAYDKSMENIIAQTTNHAQNVGVNRQTTIDPGIVGGRGYFKHSEIKDNCSITKSMGMTEALSPFMTTSDDPFRNNMGFTQTAKHGTPIENGMPLLVTTGADQAMPYLCSDMFAFKAKKPGKIKEITDDYMIIEYNDKTTDYVNLAIQTVKNSDGGFYLELHLVTDLKEGSKVKEGQLVAWDKKSFSKKIGLKQLSYNIGCLAKIAIMTNEDGFEDSGVCSEWLSEAMASNIVNMKDINLPANTNILYIAKVGQEIAEGEPLLIFQNAFEDEDANMLLKNLSIEDGDISTIGRTSINSKVTGYVSDIKVYRTCELSELSDSLLKIFKEKENKINKLKKLAKNSLTEIHFDPIEKLEQTGKLKATDGVLIEIYTRMHDKLSVGDKLVNQTANKVVLQEVYPNEVAPYTDYRPDDKIDIISSASSIDGRMITSPFKLGAMNKLLIELQRKCAEIYGKKPMNMHEMYDYFNNK